MHMPYSEWKQRVMCLLRLSEEDNTIPENVWNDAWKAGWSTHYFANCLIEIMTGSINSHSRSTSATHKY